MSWGLARGKGNFSFFNLHSSLSFILSIALLFGASGAWAADWTDKDDPTVTYTALKSLKGNGDGEGYLVTDIVPNCTDIVMMKFKPATVSSSYSGAYFCARNASANGMFTCYRPSNKIRLDRGASNTANQKTSTGTISTSYEYLLTADYGRRTATIIQDGSSSDLFGQMLGGDASYTVGSPLAFFALHKDLDGFNTFERGYIYYFELYDSNTNLTHCLLPAQRNDSVYGFYDTRTGTFYKQSGGVFTPVARTVTVTGTCKKWIGRGDSVSMSDGANWEGGVVPGEGDDLDFTLAAPLAKINADIQDVTFGKLWIDDGDIPTFTGSMTVSGCNNRAKIVGNTSVVFLAGSYTWRGTERNWGDADAWTLDNAATTWADNNNAIFNTVDATATLTKDAMANSLVFNQNATVDVDGTATLTVPTVSVAQNVTATIAAPTEGALEKTGEGMLTLGSSRSDATTVTEGTLRMLNGKTVADLTLGTSDPTKPVTFDYGGQTLTRLPGDYFVNGSNVTLTNGVFRAGGNGNMTVRDASDSSIPDVLTIAKGATLSKYGTSDSGAFVINRNEGESTINVVGGTLHSGKYGYIQQSATTGTLRINITDGGTFSFAGATFVMCNGNKPDVAKSPKLFVSIDQSTFKAEELHFGSTATYFPAEPTGVIAATNSTVIIPTVAIGRNASDNYNTGFYTFDFEDCTVTTKTFTVNHDRPFNNARFNDTRLVFSANSGSLVARTAEDKWFTIGDDGLTIDTQDFSATLNANLGGSGAVTKVGAGTLIVASNQTSNVALGVNEGTLAVNGGVSIARPLTVATGTTLALDGATQSSFGALTLAAGSTLDIATPAPDVAAFAVTTLNLPPEGTVVTLSSGGGAFVEGIYAICKMSGVKPADGAKFAPSTGELDPSWSVDGDTLILTVGAIDDNTWTGGANNGNLSDPKNWLGGAVPTSGTVTINTSGELTVGGVFSPDVIVFPETCGAVTIKGENPITGLAAVTNLSPSICTFEVPVAFVDKIDVYQTAYYYIDSKDDSYESDGGGHVRFAGGVTGSSFAEGTSHMLEGAYFVPATAGWQAVEADTRLWGIKRGSSLTITGSSGETPAPTNTSRLLISGGSAITTGVMRTSSRLSYRVYGEYVITNELEVALEADTYIAQAKNGTYKLEKLTLKDNGTGRNFYVANSTRDDGTKHLYIGVGGINVNGTASTSTALVCGYDKENSHDVTHLHPWHGDYAINGKGGSTRDILVYRTTYLHTDDENGDARTVTLNGIADVRATLTVNGSGRFQVNSNGMNGANTIGGITVTDSATLAYAPGADLGAGAVTVDENATMEVASGVNTFGGGLILNDGATLAFNFTQRAVTPQIAIADGKALTVNGEVKVKIPENSKWPTAGEKILTTCGDFNAEDVSLADGAPKWAKSIGVNEEGNIVLTVRPKPTMIIVR